MVEVRDNLFLRPLWHRLFGQAWVLVLLLFLLLSGLRAYGILGPEEAGVRQLIVLSFFLMWFLPYVFFGKDGRRAMGLKGIERPIWLLWGALLGTVASLIVFVIGFLLYGRGVDNWYVAISRQYLIDDSMLELPRLGLVVMFTQIR